ncbi:hypothetical protein AQUCO_05500081v1 [Aquilegia coerulea]|uniref:ZZ-type domain-containing protein n=1 Tax=Aquilegia coerulea TaxID=218851 RepID=A0A2G5CH39_AQUCA|nr:hypothetical protein AQUCO_05500081v1 [Aquilegia coerulea]
MAEALISVVLEQLGTIAISELVKEVELLAGVDEEVESLIGTLTLIQGVLEDAEQKQVTNKAVKFWLDKIKKISYDAEDVLDEWNTRILISKLLQPDVNAPVKEKVRSHLFNFFCCAKPIVIRHAIGVEIRELNEQLEGLAKKKDMFNLTEIRSQRESRQMTSSIVDVSDIYGRRVDKQVIMSKLMGEASHHDSKVPVISIVGTGGFGKTTLAQLILKEEEVINHFEKQIWVCVSDPFDHQEVAKEIIKQATGKVIDSVGWETLHRSLSESIQGKRFVLVLDDVWSLNGEIWKQLKTSFDGGAIGSRIIITTRDETIAERMGSTFIHRLGQLSDGDSWLMFRRIAFWQREDDLENFQGIAVDIAQRCRGVPLSIRVLASLMRLKKTIQDWRNVQASNIWNVQFQEGEEGFLPSILFSYYALPAKLKPCLVYCAILPKDSRIEKKEMVELWMAQGFLGSDGRKDLEIEGGHYFDNLAMRSFFQDFKEDSKGNITSCKMHDLVHDFVQFLSKGETCILFKDEELENVNVRHLTTFASDKPSIYELKKLRTLRSGGYIRNKITCLGLIHQLTSLRVLDLCNSDVEEFPSEVARLLHLRYLDLSNTKLKELPETICNLFNLQTLKLEYCEKLVKLPKGIGKLCSLRHLMIKGTRSLTYLPAELGKLCCLRTLDKFIIGGGDEIEGEGCNIRKLGLLNNLHGKLQISNLGQVANANEAKEANLEKKKTLQSLILSFRTLEAATQQLSMAIYDDVGILEGFVPDTNLEELTVEFYKGTKLPDWILLSHLVKLKLHYLISLLQLPALGKLPFLEILELHTLWSVEHIGEEFYGLSSCGGGGGRDSVQHQIVFPKLKKLEFIGLQNLEEWDLPYQNDTNKIDFFPNLVELEISRCHRLQALPPGLGKLKSLKFLKLSWMDGLKSFLSINDRKGDNVEKEDNGEFVKPPVVLFPALTSLQLEYMREWEEETIPDLSSTASITIMPCLSELKIGYCEMLKVIPLYMLSPVLKDLEINFCPQLTRLPSCLPPLLEKLKFGFCKFLDFMPDDLNHLTKLQTLRIIDCPILAQRFKRTEEISYKIEIDVGVHFGISCDNCQMVPIVGKRYKCKDCYNGRARGFDLCEECYTTPSEHTDLVNQHHTQGHTFELIANDEDNPVQVHPDDPSEVVEGGFVVTKSAEIEELNKA